MMWLKQQYTTHKLMVYTTYGNGGERGKFYGIVLTTLIIVSVLTNITFTSLVV